MALTLDIWSDIACPWCYVGKRRIEAALEQFEHRDQVELVWRAFELDQTAPDVLNVPPSYAERLARKYRTDVAGAEGMIQRMTETAAKDGIEMRFDRVRPGNTFNAHRLLHLALEHGGPKLQDTLKERFFRAYLTDGKAIGDRAVLREVAIDVGLPLEDVDDVLETDRFETDVRQEEGQAVLSGISGVPFFVFHKKYGVSGAQPVDMLLEVLRKVWDEAVEAGVAFAEGAACGPDGC